MHWKDFRAAWLMAAAFATACIVDNDEPCSRGQMEVKGAATGCMCMPGYVPSPDNTSCVACDGEHEEAMNGMCQCEAGYKRMGGACKEVVDAGDDARSDAGAEVVTGQDEPCGGQSECAVFDADFCLPFPGAMTCAVRNCANKEQTCASDRVCCDVSGAAAIFPDLKMANGICVTSAACAMGGKVVTP